MQKQKRWYRQLVAAVLVLSLGVSMTAGSSEAEETTYHLTTNGAPQADIMIRPGAGSTERLAAEELQQTVAMISGARLPALRGAIEDTPVSAYLWTDTIALAESGSAAIDVSLMNNSANPVTVRLETAMSGLAIASFEKEVVLAPYTGANATGIIEVAPEAADGTYSIPITLSVDAVPYKVLQATVELNRNVLYNPSFEAGSGSLPGTGWVVSSGALDDQVARTGQQSMRMDFSAPYTVLRTDQQLKLEAGKPYKLEAWVKGSLPAGQQVVAQFIEMSSDWQSSAPMPQTTYAIHDGWTRIELDYTPSSATQLDFVSCTFYLASGSDPIWIDDVALRAVDTEVDAPPLIASAVDNGGFEQTLSGGVLPVGWNVPSGAVDTGVKHSGAASLRVDIPAAGWTYARTEPLHGLELGETYVLKAWVKGSQPSGQQVLVSFMEKDGVDWSDLVPPTPMEARSLDTGWTLMQWQFTPQTAAGTDFHLAYFYAVNDQLWIDDVSLSKISDANQDGQPGPGEHTRIHLGTPSSNAALATLFPADLAQLADSDGFAVRQHSGETYILGTEPGGVLNGVYDFLERNTGILWTRSTEVGTVYEEQATLAIDETDYTEQSPFRLRGWHLTGLGASGEYHSDPGTEQMMARNKLNSKLAEFENMPLWEQQGEGGVKPFNLGHNLTFWLPNDIYFAAHPDYYNTDANGDPLPVGHDTQINFYHPDVPGVIAGRVADFLAEHPIDTVGIAINDTHYFEQAGYSDQPFVTEDMVTIYPNEADYKSTVYFTFLNKIARQVKLTNPGVQIATYAYFFTEVPPRVAVEDNIVIVLAPISGDDREPIDTPDPTNPNQAYVAKLTGWLAKTDNIVMYNYYGAFPAHQYERPIAAKVQGDLQYYASLGLTGVIPEGVVDANGPQWGVNAMQFWLFQKLMWNPDANLAQLKSDYLAKVYGPAASAMATYYSLIESGWNMYDDVIAYYTDGSTYIGKYIIDAGIAGDAQLALDNAWALADQKIKARIAPIKETFEAMVAAYSAP
ncbi:hypothetical protein PA598K_06269 [Paenibacillus sp. 598K]|uniref:DUF4838 domain-containing protein n=1 Tax=Paenibacillus sp. 598K TaxID=1117987 RepID=UPI000FFAE961|nr:DUF4838 domain-containing protein [Paenibacillus sp. 598K]GBF77707.1 hypothetical protein PA598K_06269 [Paenibacillus sp. 598K]